MTPLLSIFTPSMMSQTALETLFVQRHALADRLIERIRESSSSQSKHHTLLVGPRGIGKTHLISLLYHRVRAAKDLDRTLVVVWLREEEWGIASFRDVLLRILTTAAAEYSNDELHRRTEEFYSRHGDEAEALAGELLREFVGAKTLLLLSENLDQLFQALGEIGQKRFRAYVQENSFFTILATSQSLFPAVSRRRSPFYGFFRIEHLRELVLEEAIQLIRNIAALRGNSELSALLPLPTGRARVRAVHHLAGGNHRVYVIFSQFLTAEALDDLVGPLMKTIDDLTPYYQSRMADISPQQRRLVEMLSERGGASAVKDIAGRSFISSQTASKQLKTLLDSGYVRVTQVGRESYYELREPLMRLCLEVKKNRAEPVRLFVDFLRYWYSAQELQAKLDLLPEAATWERRCLSDALSQAYSATEDPKIAAAWHDFRSYFSRHDYDNALAAAEDLVALRGSSVDWDTQAHCLGHLLRWEDALSAIKRAVEIDPTNSAAWARNAWVLGNLERVGEALEAIQHATELDPNVSMHWDARGDVLCSLGRYIEAIESYDRAIALERTSMPFVGKARALHSLGHDQQALESLDEALKLDSKNADLWEEHARILYELGRYDEALRSIDRAFAIDGESSHLWSNKGLILCRLRRTLEEHDAFRKAAELDPSDVTHRKNLAIALSEAGKSPEALNAIDTALKLAPSDPVMLHARGTELIRAARFDDALSSLDLAEAHGDSCPQLRIQKADALIALGRWDDAVSMLDAALEQHHDALSRYSKPMAGLMFRVVSSAQPTTWKARATELVRIFARHNAVPLLGRALVATIGALKSPRSDLEREKWYEAWKEASAMSADMQLPLRLLRAAVQFLSTHDQRVLLELPSEERQIISSLIHDGNRSHTDDAVVTSR